MFDLDEMTEEQDQMLRELAELGMDFAHDLKAQVKLVKSVEDAGLFDEFLSAPFETAVARIRKDLGLPGTSSSSPVSTEEGDHPPKSGGWRGQAKPTTEPSPPPPRPLQDVVPLPRCEAEEKKKPAPS